MCLEKEKNLPWRELRALKISLERAERFGKANKKLTSVFENFDLLLAKFGHFCLCLK